MTYEDWIETYKPIQNPIDSHACFEGTLIETFGEEREFIRTQPDNQIWTLIDEDDDMFILTGFHFVNRMGYFITEVPYTESVTVELIP